ncbi:MAG: transcriptional regulator, MerR family [Actinomycetia bacterium]|nr:transcriptional regulator, MerR family [Actinomycetes bacterium]
MTGEPVPKGKQSALLAIGAVARRAGVTTRTLRYYQEMGLLHPSGVTMRGNRLYSDADVDRLQRILELRDVMGFDLERIRLILQTEDRLAQLRAEAARGTSPDRRREMVTEAMDLNARLQREVNERLGLLQGFLAELHAKASRYRDIVAELDADAARR